MASAGSLSSRMVGPSAPSPNPLPQGEGEYSTLQLLPLPLREGVGGGGAAHSTKRPPRRTAPSTRPASARTAGSAAHRGTHWPTTPAAHPAAYPAVRAIVAPGSRSACIARSRGDVSIRCSRSAALECRRHRGGRRAAHRPSACRGRGRPPPAAPGPAGRSAPRSTAAHSPRISPNTWLISGDVVKSRNGSWRRVVGGVGARHEAVQPLHQRVRRISQALAISIGMHSNWPIVTPPIRKPRNTSGSRKNSQVMRAMA